MQTATAFFEYFSTVNESVVSTTPVTTENTTCLNVTLNHSSAAGDIRLQELLPDSLVITYKICVNYITFMILIIAVPANILIISILTKKRHISSSTSVYFLSLAVADLCVNFRTLNFWLVRSKLVTYTTDFECQMEKGYPLFGMLASSWTLVAISTERMLSVCLPYKVKHVCKASIARVYVAIVWIVSLSVAVFNGWFHKVGKEGCELRKEYRDFFINYISYVDYFSDVVVPFFIILFNSIITLVRLRSRTHGSHKLSKAFGKSVTVLVLFVNAVFFITQVPYGIVFIVQQINIKSASKLQKLYLHYLESILLVLKYINYAINFYIYFLAALKFRYETKKLIGSCKKRCLACNR